MGVGRPPLGTEKQGRLSGRGRGLISREPWLSVMGSGRTRDGTPSLTEAFPQQTPGDGTQGTGHSGDGAFGGQGTTLAGCCHQGQPRKEAALPAGRPPRDSAHSPQATSAPVLLKETPKRQGPITPLSRQKANQTEPTFFKTQEWKEPVEEGTL